MFDLLSPCFLQTLLHPLLFLTAQRTEPLEQQENSFLLPPGVTAAPSLKGRPQPHLTTPSSSSTLPPPPPPRRGASSSVSWMRPAWSSSASLIHSALFEVGTASFPSLSARFYRQTPRVCGFNAALTRETAALFLSRCCRRTCLLALLKATEQQRGFSAEGSSPTRADPWSTIWSTIWSVIRIRV